MVFLNLREPNQSFRFPFLLLPRSGGRSGGGGSVKTQAYVGQLIHQVDPHQEEEHREYPDVPFVLVLTLLFPVGLIVVVVFLSKQMVPDPLPESPLVVHDRNPRPDRAQAPTVESRGTRGPTTGSP